jgi:muramoyltetrapeptide carboxypeptidase LdcA involved in peptidoglycan recycling
VHGLFYPPKPRPGDRVAVLSPSAGLPAIFPGVYEQGLGRLRDELDLRPVEFPTTRTMNADPRARAADIHAAFADPTITAVLATIGGDDEITVLRHLDAELLRANPKPFFGFSDNTNLLTVLFDAGVVGYHGGSVMVHLGRGGGTNPVHLESLRAALFTHEWYELAPAADYSDEPIGWADPAGLSNPPPMWPGTGWTWTGDTTRVVQAPSWGGNLEVLSWLLQAGKIRDNDAYAGDVLLIETSEELPPAVEVHRILRNMGERGLLAVFAAVLVGRAKAADFDKPRTPGQKRAYAQEQRDAVQRAIGAYNPQAVVVFDVDFGHTDPQLIIPYGGTVRVDGPAQTVTVLY